jgi:hypothetical protein
MRIAAGEREDRGVAVVVGGVTERLVVARLRDRSDAHHQRQNQDCGQREAAARERTAHEPAVPLPPVEHGRRNLADGACEQRLGTGQRLAGRAGDLDVRHLPRRGDAGEVHDLVVAGPAAKAIRVGA